MRKLLQFGLLLSLVLIPVSGLAQGFNGGILYASDFNAWNLPQGTGPATGSIHWQDPTICKVGSAGYNFVAPKVGRPLLIRDVDPSLSETVIPTQVIVGPQGCTVTAPMVRSHFTYTVWSGTAGLQEAIDYNAGKWFGALVFFTRQWTEQGGVDAMLTGLTGNNAVWLVDERTNCPVPYTWNLNHYQAGSSWCGGGGGSGPELQTNGVDNLLQSILNLEQGNGITITNTSGGNVRFDVTPPGPTLEVQTNGLDNTSQTLLNHQDSATITWANPVGGVEQANCVTATGSTLGCSRPDNSSITISGGILSAHPSSSLTIQQEDVTLGGLFAAGAGQTLDFNSALPAPPANSVNCAWQTDPATGRISCSVPALNPIEMVLVPPIGGNYVILYPSNNAFAGGALSLDNKNWGCEIVGASGLITSGSCSRTLSGPWVDVNGKTLAQLGISTGSVTAVYGVTYSNFDPGYFSDGSGVSSIVHLECTGLSPTALSNSGIQSKQVTALTGLSGAGIAAATCPIQIQRNSSIGTTSSNSNLNIASLALMAFYSGPSVGSPNSLKIGPGLFFDPPTNTLSVDPAFPVEQFGIAIAKLPSPTGVPPSEYIVTDASDPFDCSIGGGSLMHGCDNRLGVWTTPASFNGLLQGPAGICPSGTGSRLTNVGCSFGDPSIVQPTIVQSGTLSSAGPCTATPTIAAGNAVVVTYDNSSGATPTVTGGTFVNIFNISNHWRSDIATNLSGGAVTISAPSSLCSGFWYEVANVDNASPVQGTPLTLSVATGPSTTLETLSPLTTTSANGLLFASSIDCSVQPTAIDYGYGTPLREGIRSEATGTAVGVTGPYQALFRPTCAGSGTGYYGLFALKGAAGGGGGGSVSLTSPTSTLSLSPSTITGTGTLDLNLNHANTWTATQTFSSIVDSSITPSTLAICANGAGGAFTTIGCSGGGGGGVGGSGTTGFLPEWTASTTLGNSPLDDGVTLTGWLTSNKPFQVVAATLPTELTLTYNGGHAPTGSAGSAVLAPDTSGNLDVDENNTGFARVCTATNGICATTGVTSFSAGNLSPLFTTSVATATTTPALTFSLSTQSANLVFAGPNTGSAAAPTFRSLVAADLPNTAVTPGSYTNPNITVDAQGRITLAANGSGSGLSGMTTGQIPVAASATTVTSSKALAGSGAGITTGPTTSTNLDCAQFSGTTGQIADAGAPCGSGSGGGYTNVTGSISETTVALINTACGSGTYYATTPLSIATGGTVTCPVQFSKVGLWTVASGQTVTFAQKITETDGPHQHFAGTGSVVLAAQNANAEWFGAVGDGVYSAGTGTDNAAAFQKTIDSLTDGNMILQCATYKSITAVNVHARNNVGIQGCQTSSKGNTTGTVVFTTSASATIFDFAGTGVALATYMYHNYISDLDLKRTIQPTGTATGLSLQFMCGAFVSRVFSEDSERGFYLQGFGNCGVGRIEDSNAQFGFGSFTPNSSVAYYGFYLDGSSVPFASTVISRPGVGTNGLGALVIHPFYVAGTIISDVMVDGLQTETTAHGIEVVASNGGGFHQSDLHFTNFILDNCRTDCIATSGLLGTNEASVEFGGGWVSSSAGSYGINIDTSIGVQIHNIQIFPNGGMTTAGILLHNSQNILVANNYYFGGWSSFQNNGSSIIIDGTTASTVSGNMFAINPVGTITNVILENTSTENSVTGNQISGGSASNTGISADATSINNRYINLNAFGSYTTKISDAGTGNQLSSTLSNALTMNNSGSGATSGSTFDGTAAKTISYNTIGASPTAGNSSLVTVGTLTAGTWHATTIGALYGGTGIDTSASTGIAQVAAGTWSVSTALANGTTATTQSANDNSTKVATTAYVDTRVRQWSCEPGLGDGLNAVTAGTYLQTTCYNTTGSTVTLTGLSCFTDNGGTSTMNASGHTLGSLLTGAVTCTTAFAAGTQSANVLLTSGDYIAFTFVADGTTKQTTWVVKGTY